MVGTPVLLIPGYLGTRLRHRHKGHMVWGTFRSLYQRRPEDLAGDCEPAGEVDAITVIPRVWKYDIYGRLKRALGSRLITFTYDWRRSHADTARELARFLARFDRPVHAIAHSTGGYLLDYCLRYGDTPLEQTREPAFRLASRFASVTWVGVPWKGTVHAMRDLTLGWRPAPFGSKFPPHTVRTFESVYEVMPTWKGAWRSRDGKSVERDPFDGAPRARLFREALERGPAWAPVPARLVICDRIRTRAAVCLGRRGLSFDKFWTHGDGTVPIESALGTGRTIPPDAGVSYVRGRHRYLLSRPAVIKLVRSWVS